MRESLLKLLHATPLLKLLIPFVLGIIVAGNIDIPIGMTVLFAFLSLTFALFFTLRESLDSTGWYISIFVFFLALGIVVSKLRVTAAEDYETLHSSTHFVGIITSLAEPVPYGQRYTVRIVNYRDSVSWKSYNARIIIYVRKQVGLSARPGQYIAMKNVSLRLKHLKPFPFNKSQSEFYFLQNISGIAYIEHPQKIVVLPFRDANILHRIQNLREQLLNRANAYFTSTSERSIFQSLFFGYRAEMDQELTNAYATAGVIHILSVSGLHVGIIYLFFLFITAPLKHNLPLRITRTIVTILAIWFYGLLAGFSPPVIRSCSMFTILGISQLIQRESFPFNSLFVSAFIILFLAPHQLYDVGFQLSYAAMAGIFLFYQPFAAFMETKNYVGKKVGELIAVSLAAQLGTLPLTLYYFNSFPLYFLLANLIIVPFATLIMYTGIIFLVLLPFTQLATYAADILTHMIEWLNKMVMMIEQLPYASLKGFYPNIFQSLALAGLILTFAYVIHYRNLKYLPLCLTWIILYQAAEIVKYANGYFAQQIIIVPSQPSGMICYQNKNQLTCISAANPPAYFYRYLNNYRKHYYLGSIKTINLSDNNLSQNPTKYQIQIHHTILTLMYPINQRLKQQKLKLANDSTYFFPPNGMLIIKNINKEYPHRSTIDAKNEFYTIHK